MLSLWLILLALQSILYSPTALNPVGKRILVQISMTLGPIEVQTQEPANVDERILPFDVEAAGRSLGFEPKKGSLIKRITISFIQEFLDLNLEQLKY